LNCRTASIAAGKSADIPRLLCIMSTMIAESDFRWNRDSEFTNSAKIAASDFIDCVPGSFYELF